MFPLLPVAIAFIAGILLRGAVSEVWWSVAMFVPAVVLLCVKRIYPAILSLCAVAGFFVAGAHAPRPLVEWMHDRPHRWSGTVDEHREYEGAQMLIVRVDSCAGQPCPSFQAMCIVPSLIPVTDATDRVEFVAAMDELTDDSDLPDGDDYVARMRRLGVTVKTIVEPDAVVSVTPEPGVLNDVRRLRRDVQQLIACAPLSAGSRSFLMAALTGDRTWLQADTRELFSSTGIAHILALSGLHVGVLTVVLTVLLMPFSAVIGGRYGRMIATVVMLWAFAVLTGLSPSVVRAVIMATMFAGCTMLQRVWSPLNALSAAAIIILLFSPVQIYTLGFMLTFLAVLSIIVFAERLNPFDYRRPRLRSVASYLCVTLAAMLGTGMVCAMCFHIFPVYFLITNIVVSLLLPPLLGGGVVLILFNAIGFEAVWLGKFVDWLMAAVEVTARAIAAWPGAALTDVWIPSWTIGLYFALLALFGLWLYRRRVVMLYAMGVLSLFGVVLALTLRDADVGHETYITRSSTETTMLVRDGKQLYAYTTAPVGRLDEVIDAMAHRHRNYMLHRGIRDITPLHDGMQGERVAREGNVVVAGGRRFVFLSHDSHARPYVSRPDYAVVCRGFRGDICETARMTGADTILLSRDLNLRRHDRYMCELAVASIPHRTLRDAPFKIN